MGNNKMALAADVVAALEYAGLQEKFDSLPLSEQQKFVMWIDEPDSEDERAQRITLLCDELADK